MKVMPETFLGCYHAKTIAWSAFWCICPVCSLASSCLDVTEHDTLISPVGMRFYGESLLIGVKADGMHRTAKPVEKGRALTDPPDTWEAAQRWVTTQVCQPIPLRDND